MRRVQARVAALGRDEQAAVWFAVVEALRPLAELGDQFVAPADAGRLLAGARSASPEVLRRVLAEAEALPGMTAGEEPPGNAVFAVDLLACLTYAIKTMTEPDPAVWSGHCVQRADDCLYRTEARSVLPSRHAALRRRMPRAAAATSSAMTLASRASISASVYLASSRMPGQSPAGAHRP